MSQEFQREDRDLAWKVPGKTRLSANKATFLLGCLRFRASASLCLCVPEHLEEWGGPQLLSFLVLMSRQAWDLSVPVPDPLLDSSKHPWSNQLMHRTRVL